jgi:predicted ArsR family transcriptional regulator
VKTTRERIVEYLQVRRHATAAELGRVLHLTSANIRHHLAVLEKEGVVEVTGQRALPGRGRPVRIFALCQQTGLHNLDHLASSLLHCWERQETAAPLQAVAREMLSDAPPPSGTPTRRLSLAVETLNQMNYQARWEAHASGPRLILGHCPYLAILDQHPELCQMDAYLLEEMLASPARQLARRELNPQGLPQCIFTLAAKKPGL